ncbi:hypothetical protein CDD83_4949 [Cordyceps sp. RAO-2017]|nr:hypothetical protein CDD83_4949 [Cordyceps sp. RAO-2017]
MALPPPESWPPTADDFTKRQNGILVTLERVGGSISLIALMFIFIAYALFRPVRNVQNTFIVFASVSNVGASIASIIALDGLHAGKSTALCQTQSFLFEMFMQSDPWWSLAMAINVFLVFYFRTSPDSFRRWWWLYCLICYGGPFVIALALLFVKNQQRGSVYGQATIWCWVDVKWDSIRIYTYYMLIWICIVGSFVCYILVGYHVFRTRNQLHSFSASRSREAGPYERAAACHEAARDEGCYGTVTTEVHIIHSSASTACQPVLEPKPAHLSRDRQASFNASPAPDRHGAPAQYYSTVTSAAPRRARLMSPLDKLVRSIRRAASRFVIDDPVKRAYLRTSLLFALSVLVTWIPSSLNRINSWLNSASPYEFHVATAAVLPLQGLWNFLIFFVTSWRVVRRCVGVGGRSADWPRDDDTLDRAAAPGRERHGPGDDGRSETDGEDVESGNMGSDVELRRVRDDGERKARAGA